MLIPGQYMCDSLSHLYLCLQEHTWRQLQSATCSVVDSGYRWRCSQANVIKSFHRVVKEAAAMPIPHMQGLLKAACLNPRLLGRSC
jgi:hypothetical protein